MNNNTWSNTIRGRAVKGNKLFEYKLQTLAVINGDAKSPFDYAVYPISLTVVEMFLPRTITILRKKLLGNNQNAFMRRHEILNQMKSIDYHLGLFNISCIN